MEPPGQECLWEERSFLQNSQQPVGVLGVSGPRGTRFQSLQAWLGTPASDGVSPGERGFSREAWLPRNHGCLSRAPGDGRTCTRVGASPARPGWSMRTRAALAAAPCVLPPAAAEAGRPAPGPDTQPVLLPPVETPGGSQAALPQRSPDIAGHRQLPSPRVCVRPGHFRACFCVSLKCQGGDPEIKTGRVLSLSEVLAKRRVGLRPVQHAVPCQCPAEPQIATWRWPRFSCSPACCPTCPPPEGPPLTQPLGLAERGLRAMGPCGQGGLLESPFWL